VIVVDTSAIVALIDRHDRHHKEMLALHEASPSEWMLPWAVLPEVDYMLASHVSSRAQQAFLEDIADGDFPVDWGDAGELAEAREILTRHRALRMGLVDAVVVATAVRLKARAIATLDVRHFGAISIPGSPKLFPRDL
jgi:uncharacterized protein